MASFFIRYSSVIGCAVGFWGGRCLSLAAYVAVTGTTGVATAADGANVASVPRATTSIRDIQAAT
jgi:hypothetical protein